MQTLGSHFATTREEIQQKINLCIDKSYSKKLTLQLFLCAVGDDHLTLREFYVYFSGIFYKLGNIVKSIDICFKIFQILDLEYPAPCKQVWVFIDQYFYTISKFKDSSVATFINDLKT